MLVGCIQSSVQGQEEEGKCLEGDCKQGNYELILVQTSFFG